jgi:hypothetical protein
MTSRVSGALRRVDGALFGVAFGRYYAALEETLRGCATVLDVGCGAESPLRFVTNGHRAAVGLDMHLPSLAETRRRRIHGSVVCGSVLQVASLFPPRSFDAVVALDVIEHLPKHEGDGFLRQLETIARRKVVVFTPNGFLPQGAVGGNELQRHVSGWTAEEMRARGYCLSGMSGWKPLRGREAVPALRPRPLWERVARWTEPFVVSHPERAFQLLCVKDVASQRR